MNEVNYIKVEDSDSAQLFYQRESEGTEARKVIDLLLEAPSGSSHRIEIVTNGKALAFQVGDINLTDLVKAYNGVRVRKSA